MALPPGAATSAPPLLLTKRLTSFLQTNRTPSLPTLLVTTPTGKLLAHASPQPVAVLRTHATVAASLLTIHTSSSASVPTALAQTGSRTPPSSTRPGGDSDDDETAYSDDDNDSYAAPRSGRHTPTARRQHQRPVTITVQLSGGTVLIRRLRCGLLFVCIGPPAEGSLDAAGPGDTLMPPSTSPSDAGSLVSAGAQTATSLDSQGATAVVAMRRHAAEMARWLDDKLGTLVVPDEGVGVE